MNSSIFKRHIQECLRRSNHPIPFRHSNTVVLRKPQEAVYNVPKAYRAIALLNRRGKVLEAIVARRILYLDEQHDLFPLELLVEQIRAVWSTDQLSDPKEDSQGLRHMGKHSWSHLCYKEVLSGRPADNGLWRPNMVRCRRHERRPQQLDLPATGGTEQMAASDSRGIPI